MIKIAIMLILYIIFYYKWILYYHDDKFSQYIGIKFKEK